MADPVEQNLGLAAGEQGSNPAHILNLPANDPVHSIQNRNEVQSAPRLMSIVTRHSNKMTPEEGDNRDVGDSIERVELGQNEDCEGGLVVMSYWEKDKSNVVGLLLRI